MKNFKSIFRDFSVINKKKLMLRLNIENFNTKRKSIYSKNKNISEFNDGNTIDITESQKEMELNIDIEMKNLDK